MNSNYDKTTCYVCFECGRDADVDHHVVPRSRGGKKTVPLCEACHGKAHGRVMETNVLTREALARKKAIGERCGSLSFGFDLADDGKTLVPNAYEQSTVELIRKLRYQGMTLRGIASELNQQSIRTKKGKAWLPSTIKNILDRFQK